MIGENLEPDEVWYIIEKAGAGYAARYYGIGEE